MALRKRAVASAGSGASKNRNSKTASAAMGSSSRTAASRGANDELSLRNLLPAILVSTFVSVGSYYSCGSVDLAEDVLVCTIRTFVQLSLLAALLSPLFRFVDDQQKTSGAISAPILVLAYVFCFMLPLAAYEASSRSKLTLRPTDHSFPINNIVLLIVMFSLFMAVLTMGSTAIFAIIRPTPLYSPRHVIPLCGMLFNNALSAISLALDILFTELQSKQRETIELMICFGADPWSATRPSFRSVLAAALKPQINSMNVIGLVAIPGMMTGQVLSGSSPIRAARYQIMIMCLILGGCFISVALTLELIIWNSFEERGALRDDWVVDNDSLRVSQLITASFALLSTLKNQGKTTLQEMDDEFVASTVTRLSVIDQHASESEDVPFLHVNLGGSYANGKRNLIVNFSIPTHGSIAILQGASGVGKTTVLKSIAELNSGLIPSSTKASMTAYLSGKDRNQFHPSKWRQNVLYLPQTGASMLQGTPESFLAFLSSAKHQKHGHMPTNIDALTSFTTNYITNWGLSPQKLQQPWSKLSGGEAQRVLLAIALATEPKVLLLDESTSALDLGSKLLVEKSLKESADAGCAIVIVTHDIDQIARIGTMRMNLDISPQ